MEISFFQYEYTRTPMLNIFHNHRFVSGGCIYRRLRPSVTLYHKQPFITFSIPAFSQDINTQHFNTVGPVG